MKQSYAIDYDCGIDEDDAGNIAVADEIRQCAKEMSVAILADLKPIELVALAVDEQGITRSDEKLLEAISTASSTFADNFSHKIPKKILVYIQHSGVIDEDLQQHINNIGLSKSKKTAVMTPSHELRALLVNINLFLRENALSEINNKKDSEKLYESFLMYLQDID
jgi:hypothetical protein